MKNRVLVVGGAGYVGSHACKALSLAGYEPVVLDNLIYGHKDAVKWGAFAEGDILNEDLLDRVFEQYRPDAVMHFAAFAYVGESVQDPENYYLNNVAGSLSLLRAMRRHGTETIVFSSTCATYGVPDNLPIVENTQQNPINPYGFSKLIVERMLADYGRAYGLKWIALRYFNAAGCDPDGELGERHSPETHAIPLAVMAALGDGSRFKVFGTDYDTPDGTAVRDYVHVTDLADAHVKALSHIQGQGVSGPYNLGTGHGTSVLEMLQAVGDAVGREVPVDFAARRPGDPPILFADSTKANADLRWTPVYRDIGSIVETTVPWFQKHG